MKYKKWLLPKNSGHDTTNAPKKEHYSLKEFLRQIDLKPEKLKKIYGFLQGNFTSNLAGTGFDFNEVREYKIGDDLRHISWASTARTGTLHTKEYFAEKELSSFFLVDISTSMFCGNKTKPLLKLLAILLNLSCSFSEKIGGILFSDEIKYYFPLKESLSQANILFHTLFNYYSSLKKENLSNPSVTNISKPLELTYKAFSRKGIIFLISDFINLSHWEKIIFETSKKQNVYSFQIYDPLDFSLPKSGYISLLDPESKQNIIVNTDSKIIQENYLSLMNKKQEDLKSFLKKSGINHLLIEKKDFE